MKRVLVNKKSRNSLFMVINRKGDVYDRKSLTKKRKVPVRHY